MKQFIFPVVLLAFLGGLIPALRAGSPCCEKQGCCANAEDHYNKELLDIVQTTKSVDAFVVTLNLLVDTDVDPHTAIPLIVRNAERLGVFGDTLQQDQEDQDKPSALVIEVLGTLKNRMHASHPVQGAAIGTATGAAIGGSCGSCEDHCRDKSKTEGNSDARALVLPPLREGSAATCQDTPDDAEVLRALDKAHNATWAVEISRENVEIVKEHVVDHVDFERFYPLVGMAQLHHSQWKCTVHYKQVTTLTFGYYHTTEELRAEVVYINKDHLHLYSPPQADEEDRGYERGRGFQIRPSVSP